MERYSDGVEVVSAEKLKMLRSLGGELVRHSWNIKDRREALPPDMPLAHGFYSYDLHLIEEKKAGIPRLVDGQLTLPI